MNVKFNYLYRDAGNYKSWGSVVFRNPDGMSIDEIEHRLDKALFQHNLFIAGQVSVPEVFLYGQTDATEDDISFHEFDSVEFTNEVPTDAMDRTAAEFLEVVELSSKMGWKAFDPRFPKH